MYGDGKRVLYLNKQLNDKCVLVIRPSLIYDTSCQLNETQSNTKIYTKTILQQLGYLPYILKDITSASSSRVYKIHINET